MVVEEVVSRRGDFSAEKLIELTAKKSVYLKANRRFFVWLI